MQDKSVAGSLIFHYSPAMPNELLPEYKLAAICKRFRKAAGITRAQAARDMDVSQTSIFHAEETPSEGLTKLRMRMIDTYSPYKIVGPVFLLKKK